MEAFKESWLISISLKETAKALHFDLEKFTVCLIGSFDTFFRITSVHKRREAREVNGPH